MNENKIHTSCFICNSSKLKELSGYHKAGLMHCIECGFVFCKKIPSDKELETHYNSYPRTNNISSITVKRYHQLLDSFEKYRQTNNILDVGCGDGHFLEIAKQRGWNVYGTEFTDKAIELCIEKDINVKKGALNVLNYKENSFDVITSFEVIEHINNPIEEINLFNVLLRKNGLLYITTPNFNSLSRYILKQNWNIIEYPEHLSYYSKKTIRKLLVKNGLRKIKIETTGFSFSRFQTSIFDSTTNSKSTDSIIREKSENKWHYKLAKEVINFMLITFNKGDTIKASFIK